MQHIHPELFDYAPMLLKMDKLAKELHEACLHNNYTGIPKMCNEMVVEARLLRAWGTDRLEKLNELPDAA